MKTPAAYTKMINKGTITNDVLGHVLYSINKRAKNYRDAKRKCYNDRYGNYEKALNNEQEFYKMKDDLLKTFAPTEIHRDIKVKRYTEKIYDYEPEFAEIKDKDVIWQSGYYDRDLGEFVEFKVITVQENIELYFKYYKVGQYDFHLPIDERKIDVTTPIKDLTVFETHGEDINNLLSIPFCKKVYNMILNNDLTII